jgi:hypothetical protein
MKEIRESLIPHRLDLFWRFVYERQMIWCKRAKIGFPPPWTDDPILQRERFTNVYRELDPGTKYVVEHILEVDAPRQDKLFNVMLYRLIGRAETHAALGFQNLAMFDPFEMEQALKSLRCQGKAPFTAAYMVSAYSTMGSTDKTVNIARLFGLLHSNFEEFYERIEQCSSPAEVHAMLMTAYGFGNFLAYQVLVDLLYPLCCFSGQPLLPYSHDDWASPGPGAQRGINLILKSSLTTSFLDVMRWLRDHQQTEFERLGLKFPYLEDVTGQPHQISLANIQNCLCEFHKYIKIRDGTGRGRRKFSSEIEIWTNPLPELPQ